MAEGAYGIDAVQFFLKTLTYDRTPDGFMSADAAGLSRVIDKFFQNDGKGRLIMADAFVTPALLDRMYQQAFTADILEFTSAFQNTDETAPTDVTVNDDPAKSFPNAVDTETKVELRVPSLYDDSGNIDFYLQFSSSIAGAATFGIAVEWSVNGGAITVVGGAVTITPDTTANVQKKSAAILSLTAANVSPNDRVMVKIKRIGTTDSSTGALRIYDVRQESPPI